MSKTYAAILILLFVGCEKKEKRHPISEINESKETKIVQGDIREMYRAIYSADFDTLLDFTHPKTIKRLGGRELARKQISKNFQPVLSIGLKLKELSFIKPPTFIGALEHDFVIVPTKVIMSANGQAVESHNFQFGVRTIGQSKWKYFEGSRITPRSIRGIFSDFPEGVTFPKCTRKKL